MGVMEISEADLAMSLEDVAAGTGISIDLRDPDGVVYPGLAGHWANIGAMLNPETGQFVSVEHGMIVLRIASIRAATGGTLPQGVHESFRKPWLARVTNPNDGSVLFYRVAEVANDYTLGVSRMQLNAWAGAF